MLLIGQCSFLKRPLPDQEISSKHTDDNWCCASLLLHYAVGVKSRLECNLIQEAPHASRPEGLVEPCKKLILESSRMADKSFHWKLHH